MTRMMKTMKQIGGTTTLMRVTQTVTKRNVMVVCIYVVEFVLSSSDLHNSHMLTKDLLNRKLSSSGFVISDA